MGLLLRLVHGATWCLIINRLPTPVSIGLALLVFAGFGALVDNRLQFGGLLFCSVMALLGALATLWLDEVQR